MSIFHTYVNSFNLDNTSSYTRVMHCAWTPFAFHEVIWGTPFWLCSLKPTIINYCNSYIASSQALYPCWLHIHVLAYRRTNLTSIELCWEEEEKATVTVNTCQYNIWSCTALVWLPDQLHAECKEHILVVSLDSTGSSIGCVLWKQVTNYKV